MKYYEVPLYWTGGKFHTANPNDLGDGWASESDLIHELVANEKAVEIPASKLPAPVSDSYGYSGMRFFRLGSTDNFTAIGER